MANITSLKSSSASGDDSSGGSESSLPQKHLQQPRQKTPKKGLLVSSESEVSAHEQEEDNKSEVIETPVLSTTQQLLPIQVAPLP